MTGISFSRALGRRVLIIGDVGTGKTELTRRLLVEAAEEGYVSSITVMDMAPRATMIRGLSVGGVLVDPEDLGVRYLGLDDIKTPRLSAKNADELLRLADYNRTEIEELLEKFAADPTDILFINDISIYLQRGDLELLWSTLGKAETVVANGYMGERLKDDLGTGVSAREEEMMGKLADRMDVVIHL